MKLTDILPVENIKIPLESDNKDEIIDELVDLITDSNPLIEKKIVHKAVVDREKSASTGIGKGIAIPHCKTAGVKEMIAALSISRDGRDFDALDGKPVNVFFLVVTPGSKNFAGPHIKCLSIISKLLGKEEFRKNLIESESPKDALRLLEEGEQNLDS
ncbi:PTS sugar transporter subunit IIA [candidate division KSB1 bacterium]